ncbi:hypothetical protein [Janthinobacterium sp.]|uniref:hypothetical protein n=1 Tax=Janthinobacterium sp. TaxID=1871054 RepID=UPI00293D6877|nr:hypothetical protein [Janthinobacterium sp.]
MAAGSKPPEAVPAIVRQARGIVEDQRMLDTMISRLSPELQKALNDASKKLEQEKAHP